MFKLMIARFPGNNSEHPDSSGYIMGLMETIAKDNRISDVIPFKKSGTPITCVRNLAVHNALKLNVDYILMIDNDMCPDCEPEGLKFWDIAWNFLMHRRQGEREYDALGYENKDGDAEDRKTYEGMKWDSFAPATVGAPYCGPPPWEQVYVMRWYEKSTGDPERSFKLTQFDREEAALRTGIEEVASLPTGLILYDARVFKHLPPPWFDYEYDQPYHTETISTEDVYQTRNASLMGMPQFVAWDCWAGHWKMKKVRKPKHFTVQSARHEFVKGVLRGKKGYDPSA